MISKEAANAFVLDLHDTIDRHDDMSPWEAVAFMLAFVMRQMADLDDDDRLSVSVYAAGVAAAMHEQRERLN